MVFLQAGRWDTGNTEDTGGEADRARGEAGQERINSTKRGPALTGDPRTPARLDVNESGKVKTGRGRVGKLEGSPAGSRAARMVLCLEDKQGTRLEGLTRIAEARSIALECDSV